LHLVSVTLPFGLSPILCFSALQEHIGTEKMATAGRALEGKGDDTVDEVAEVVQQLAVVALCEVCPPEVAVVALGP
jgi:hypothetical protein